jgi:hypothetical protein
MTNTLLSFIGGFILGFLVIWGWNTYADRSNLTVPGETTAPSERAVQEATATGTATNERTEETAAPTRIDVRDQRAGERVTIAAATLTVDGWIVIHEENSGLVGNALGAVRRDTGTYQDVEIPLLRATRAGSRYWVILYSDNGDRQFGLGEDFPLRNQNDDPITKSFNAL